MMTYFISDAYICVSQSRRVKNIKIYVSSIRYGYSDVRRIAIPDYKSTCVHSESKNIYVYIYMCKVKFSYAETGLLRDN